MFSIFLVQGSHSLPAWYGHDLSVFFRLDLLPNLFLPWDYCVFFLYQVRCALHVPAPYLPPPRRYLFTSTRTRYMLLVTLLVLKTLVYINGFDT